MFFVCAVSTSSSSGSMERSIVQQQIVGFLTDRDKTSRSRIGALGWTNKSVGRAITGSSLCGSGAKSGRHDRASALFVFPGLYINLMGYSSRFPI